MLQKIKYLIFAFIPAILVFSLLEIGLTVADFNYSDTPLEMRNIFSAYDSNTGVVEQTVRANAKTSIPFKKDASQLWVPVHSFEDHYTIEKEPGVLRIATLGCSCTAGCVGTNETYPSMMEDILSRNSSAKSEVLNAGVGSYSSFQGLQRLKHAVLKYQPDILTIFFGWNDHWVTTVPDKEVKLRSEQEVEMLNFFERFRTYQGLHYLVSKVFGKQGNTFDFKAASEEAAKKLRMRVAAEDYEKNLNEMIDIAKENGMNVLMLTAPWSEDDLHPFQNFPFPKPALITVHKRYNEIVRKVASDRHVALLDLVEIVNRRGPKTVVSRDGVHFHEDGCQFVANQIVERLHELNFI